LTDRGLTAEPQAGALKDETGEPEKTGRGEEENPFLRKGKVAHTPPKRDGSLDRINEELQRRRDFLDLSFLTQDTEVHNCRKFTGGFHTWKEKKEKQAGDRRKGNGKQPKKPGRESSEKGKKRVRQC
jgi:hypothetical protein